MDQTVETVLIGVLGQHHHAIVAEGVGAWIAGDDTAHRGVRRLLPNHALDLATWEYRRHWPVADSDLSWLRADDAVAAEKALLDALKDKNVEVIAGAYSFFIRKSISGSEDLLIQALNRYGTRILWMAQDFQDCGHPPLVNAVKKWAAENNYRIDPSSGHSGPKWVTSSDKTPSIDLLKWK